MDCEYCNLPSEFTCNCNYPLLCSEHLARHVQNHNGQFLVEALNIFHNREESQALKIEALTRIKELEKSKKKLFALSNSMIKEIVSCCKKVIKNYDIHIQFYLKLIRFKKLSSSLESVVKKITDTVLIIKETSVKTVPIFEEFFKQELILIPRSEPKEEILRKLAEEKKLQNEAKEKKRIEDEEKLKILEAEKRKIKDAEEARRKSEEIERIIQKEAEEKRKSEKLQKLMLEKAEENNLKLKAEQMRLIEEFEGKKKKEEEEKRRKEEAKENERKAIAEQKRILEEIEKKRLIDEEKRKIKAAEEARRKSEEIERIIQKEAEEKRKSEKLQKLVLEKAEEDKFRAEQMRLMEEFERKKKEEEKKRRQEEAKENGRKAIAEQMRILEEIEKKRLLDEEKRKKKEDDEKLLEILEIKKNIGSLEFERKRIMREMEGINEKLVDIKVNALAYEKKQENLLKKKEILLSLGLNFNEEFSNCFNKIKFSNDSLIVFICNTYTGNFK